MPKVANEMSALAVKRLSEPGRHAVGGVKGLSLSISPNGARSWILRVRVGDKRRHIGLGSYPEVSLADARAKALVERQRVAEGVDPVEARALARQEQVARQKRELSFDDAFAQFFDEKMRKELSNQKHQKQWESTINTYVSPVFGTKSVAEIDLDDVLLALKPIWTSKTETASRLRQRIEAVLDWATAKGHRSGGNPARWKGNLQPLLPSPAKVKEARNQPAIALTDASRWFAALAKREGMSAWALRFLTLTAARSGEVRGATWEEIDLEGATWTIPAGRMKARREHKVPLSPQAVDLLKSVPRFQGSPFVFPSNKGKPLSDMSLSAVMRRLHQAELDAKRPGFVDPRSGDAAVPHGLRSTFRDWAAEKTDYPREMAEVALAHTVGSEVERAYRRGDMLERRRQMMADWAGFLIAE
ncbi:tyrosine-type recombinase/integrase [Thetidibacter halocola]|uniref:Tyrosine-type recombinase/integrase n=1 Tax=Thetidibacter halocola TaxID=2827239 RepID=A0A8J7WJ13_9RHOB|nr:site-specific integrase [Thetidibacter halocola]MBS0126531.1 tyrosine-type recombinase/integrase [Thetidibacter halocola]